MALMVSVSGIRGIFGTDLNPENIARFTAAFGTWAKGGKIVVGRDSRVTGQLCENIVLAALQSVGCDVVTLGIVPTPTVAMGVLRHEAQGGIIISASHNPAEWNALKLLNGKSEFLDADQGKAVMDIAEKRNIAYKSYQELGSVSEDKDILLHHINKILDLPYIDKDLIAKHNFKVALDAVNGAGSIAVPLLLEKLGVYKLDKLNCTPDGLFPHNPEPIPEHLDDICRVVQEYGSDIGFVVDPDADRLALVMDGGILFGEEYTLGLVTHFMMEKNAGPVATNLSSSSITKYIAEKYHQKCYQAAVGEINVVKEMQRVNAVIGGEGNGGVINPDLHYGRDSLVGIAMALQFLAEKEISLSKYRKSLPAYYLSKNKINIEGIDPDEILKEIAAQYKDREPITIDGVKIFLDEGWVHLRKSNTEPIIRIYSESDSPEKADKLAHEIMDKIKS
ncbi:MAG TPA: phosphoglucosamine mutase [Balneolales bacterium]|nr:phosphoglucosamine mutase [Balneolales bacterium]